MIDHDEIETKDIPKSLVWQGDSLVDWVHGGNVYHLDGRFEHSGLGLGYKFDDVRTSSNGIYNVIIIAHQFTNFLLQLLNWMMEELA